MNSFNKFVLIASVLLAVGAAEKGLSSKNDESSLRFPPFLKGFFCSMICPERVYLKGNTLLCFVFAEGTYYRFVGRNIAVKTWRFYKVDNTSDPDSLCRTSLTGDRFYWNQTDLTCSPKESRMETVLPDVDETTIAPESSTLEPDDDSSSVSDSRRFSIQELIRKINDEIAKIFSNIKDKAKPGTNAEEKVPEGTAPEGAAAEGAAAEGAAAEGTAPEGTAPEPNAEPARRASHRSKHRRVSARHSSAKSTRSDEVTTMGDFCHLILTEVCREHKVIYCRDEKNCCWALIRPEACQGQAKSTDELCYRRLGVVMSVAQI